MSTTATTSTTSSAQPYARLTPDTVLNALESVGLRGDGRLIALNRRVGWAASAHRLLAWRYAWARGAHPTKQR